MASGQASSPWSAELRTGEREERGCARRAPARRRAPCGRTGAGARSRAARARRRSAAPCTGTSMKTRPAVARERRGRAESSAALVGRRDDRPDLRRATAGARRWRSRSPVGRSQARVARPARGTIAAATRGRCRQARRGRGRDQRSSVVGARGDGTLVARSPRSSQRLALPALEREARRRSRAVA